MVDIEFQPIQKIVVHEIIKSKSLEDFIKMKAVSTNQTIPARPVRWIDGILFDFASVAIMTPELVNEKVHDGVVHWEIVNFVEMPEYVPMLAHPETGTRMDIIDNSNNTAVSDFIRWLKNEPIWSNAAAAA